MHQQALMLMCTLLFSSRAITSAEIVEGELGSRLDRHMQDVAAKGFGGALLVAKNGHLVIAKGFGLASHSPDVPFRADTDFDIGSITKQFTAAGIIKLEQAGKLRLDQRIGDFFQIVPPDKAPITLHQLLTHSAGLVDALGDDYDPLTRPQLVERALASQLLSAPGEQYHYSNVGYSILGAIIELVSGQSYEVFLRENLFRPAGMERTGYLLPNWDKENLARGFRRNGADWGTPLDHRWDTDGPYWNLRANGGILSTVGDLYRWHLALERDDILSPASKQKLFTPYIAEGPNAGTHYTYGWVIATTNRGTKLITHNGGNGIFFADFRRFVDEDVVLIIASNHAAHSAERYEGAVLQIVISPQ